MTLLLLRPMAVASALLLRAPTPLGTRAHHPIANWRWQPTFAGAPRCWRRQLQMSAGGGDEDEQTSSSSSSSHNDSCDAIVADASALAAAHAAAELSPDELHLVLKALTSRAAQLAGSATGMKVSDLRTALAKRGLPSSGSKAELCARLEQEILRAAATPRAAPAETSASPTPAAAAATPPPLPGVASAGEFPDSVELSVPDALQPLLDQVMAKHRDCGPQTGIFTDGSCEPNPGPGGWGVVAVSGGEVQWQVRGASSGKTTNNRMEMSAIIAALRRVPATAPRSEQHVIYTDSNLCVNTLNSWAKKWEANGWRRSDGEVKNVDLVREAYELKQARPGVEIRWQKGHAGTTWNEYADRLAGAFRHDGY